MRSRPFRSPTTRSCLHPRNAYLPTTFTVDGILIRFSDEQSRKTVLPRDSNPSDSWTCTTFVLPRNARSPRYLHDGSTLTCVPFPLSTMMIKLSNDDNSADNPKLTTSICLMSAMKSIDRRNECSGRVLHRIQWIDIRHLLHNILQLADSHDVIFISSRSSETCLRIIMCPIGTVAMRSRLYHIQWLGSINPFHRSRPRHDSSQPSIHSTISEVL